MGDLGTCPSRAVSRYLRVCPARMRGPMTWPTDQIAAVIQHSRVYTAMAEGLVPFIIGSIPAKGLCVHLKCLYFVGIDRVVESQWQREG